MLVSNDDWSVWDNWESWDTVEATSQTYPTANVQLSNNLHSSLNVLSISSVVFVVIWVGFNILVKNNLGVHRVQKILTLL